jgi:uncharacterized protein YggE
MVSTGNTLKKITLVVSFALIGFTQSAQAQASVQERTITINMSASKVIPANLIIFNVNINAEGDTPQEAFELHKKREHLLADLLKKFDIKEKNIDYEPVRMNKRYRDDRMTTATNQSVSLTFSDFSLYEKIQITLIENGFDSFNGQFSSTDISEGKQQALVSAIESAKQRAELIAKTSGVKLGKIKNIHYSDHKYGIPRKTNVMRMQAMSNEASMMDFAQTVSITANIDVTYFTYSIE